MRLNEKARIPPGKDSDLSATSDNIETGLGQRRSNIEREGAPVREFVYAEISSLGARWTLRAKARERWGFDTKGGQLGGAPGGVAEMSMVVGGLWNGGAKDNRLVLIVLLALVVLLLCLHGNKSGSPPCVFFRARECKRGRGPRR